MSDRLLAYTDSLDRTTTEMFEGQGYVVVQGLLDEEADIQPVRDDQTRLTDQRK